MITFSIEKIGIPLFWNDVRWTWFIYRNMKKADIIDKEHLKYKDKIIVFYDSWLFEVYEGQTKEEIRNKYDLGGQSNKADYLTWWQKIIVYVRWCLEALTFQYSGMFDRRTNVE